MTLTYFSMTSLPLELLSQIFRFCSPNSRQKLPLVCSSFYNAAKEFPLMSVREIFYRLFHGDLKVLYNKNVDFDEPRLVKYVQEAMDTELFRLFYEQNKGNNAECGKYVIALAMKMKIDGILPNGPLDASMKDMYEIEKIRCSRVPLTAEEENACRLFLKHIPVCVLEMIYKGSLFAIAHENHNTEAADLILRRYLCNADAINRFLGFSERRWLIVDLVSTLKLLLYPLKLEVPNDLNDGASCNRFMIRSLKDNTISLDSLRNKLIVWNLAAGNANLCQYLCEDPNLDPSIFSNHPIECVMNHMGYWDSLSQSFVLKLLKDPRVDPSLQDHSLLKHAISSKSLEIVASLLAHPKVQPPADILSFAVGRSTEVFKLLFNHPKIAPNRSVAFLNAAEHRDEAFLSLFLNDPHIDPSVQENKAVFIAARRGHFNCLKLILHHPKFDPTKNGYLNTTLGRFACNGHKAMTRLLLSIPGLDPSFGNNHIFYTVLKVLSTNWIETMDHEFGTSLTRADYIDIGKLLLKDARVKEKIMQSQSHEKGFGLTGTVFEGCL